MAGKILITDDDALSRDLLKEILKDDYEILEAEDGKRAIEIIDAHRKDLSLIFLDIVMPVMDGIEVLTHLREKGIVDQIPVIVITGERSVDRDATSYELGAADIIYKPFARRVIQKRTVNIIELFERRNTMERELESRTRELYEALEKLADAHDLLRRNNEFLINALSSVVEFRSLESGEHIMRVQQFTNILLKFWVMMHPECTFSENDIEQMVNASALHDIGKIAIPDGVLLKPGRLTDEEYEVMKTHTLRGCELLERFKQEDNDFYHYCYDICRYHHERYDGKGYPDGLAGDAIPLWAQIVSVVDVFDALVSPRVYKEAYPVEEAIRMIFDGECGCFNPDILKCFTAAKEEIISASAELQKKRKDKPEKMEGAMKVLIVDDNDFSADLVMSLIDRKDIEYIRAKDGDEAVQIFTDSAENEIAVILMDIVMENEYGNEAADQIRLMERADAKTVRIYATTAYRGFDFEGQGKSFNGAVFKPFKKEALNELVKDLERNDH